jgi:hypothetical protein
MGTAARFDAANDRISYTGGATPPDTTGMAFTCWVYLSVDQNDFSTIIRTHASSGGTTRVNLATGSSGETPCIFSPGNTSGVISPMALVVGTWRALGFSIASSVGTLICASADLVTVQSATGVVSGGSAPNSFTLGGRAPSDASEWFNGRLKYPRLWTSTMTQSEMLAEWASTTPVRSSGLWGSYVLSGPSDLNDTSGNARNLTAGSTAVTAEAGPPIDPTGLAPGAQFLPFFM